MARRKSPVGRAGNYAADVDTTGMDESMKTSLFGTGMDKTESNYVKSRGNSSSSVEAVRRSRRANKQRPLKDY